MTLIVRPYVAADAQAWDAFCSQCLQATFLHTRKFLSYHGGRFEDRSLVIEQDGKWIGAFPAALCLADSQVAVSHPGATYGGIVHQGNLRGELMIEALVAIQTCYAAQQVKSLIYKAVPNFYHQSPAQDDLYALFRLNAIRTRCDISSTIDLRHRLPVSERRRRSLKKAVKAGLNVVLGHENLGALWHVLRDNLERKHGLAPVHSLAEIELLAQRFPASIECVCGVINGTVEAGTILFITPTTYHAQYIASSEKGYDIAALDAIFEQCILKAKENNAKWFDFGISTEEAGFRLNSGLFRYKSEFGSGATVHEFYQLNC
jgi:hypothetical protein